MAPINPLIDVRLSADVATDETMTKAELTLEHFAWKKALKYTDEKTSKFEIFNLGEMSGYDGKYENIPLYKL